MGRRAQPIQAAMHFEQSEDEKKTSEGDTSDETAEGRGNADSCKAGMSKSWSR